MSEQPFILLLKSEFVPKYFRGLWFSTFAHAGVAGGKDRERTEEKAGRKS